MLELAASAGREMAARRHLVVRAGQDAAVLGERVARRGEGGVAAVGGNAVTAAGNLSGRAGGASAGLGRENPTPLCARTVNAYRVPLRRFTIRHGDAAQVCAPPDQSTSYRSIGAPLSAGVGHDSTTV